jgi:hypothetical protein
MKCECCKEEGSIEVITLTMCAKCRLVAYDGLGRMLKQYEKEQLSIFRRFREGFREWISGR